ncbi:MAG: hypothetical protein CMO30_00390 [Tistrella sp.]|nr:hypothetical protein [Tistrella sp.]
MAAAAMAAWRCALGVCLALAGRVLPHPWPPPQWRLGPAPGCGTGLLSEHRGHPCHPSLLPLPSGLQLRRRGLICLPLPASGGPMSRS